jgi:hypothetical protein
MNENSFIKFKFHYTLSRKIPFTEITYNVPNVEFVTEENYLTGFNIILQKMMEPKLAEAESNEYAYLLSDLISIKSLRYTIPSLSGCEFFETTGNTHVRGNFILKWDIEGAPARLDTIGQITDISKSNMPQIKTHLSYLAKAVVLEYEHFPEHSIIEAFKIIEKNETFPLYGAPFYYKYYALRNVLAHSPKYFPNTIRYFKDYFGEGTFDYTTYDPGSGIIILDLHSPKTQKKLNVLLREMMNEIRKYLQV